MVTLPEGMTVNPSIAEGLGVCTPADLDRETLHSAPGEGCPNASKIGTVHTESPLIDRPIEGEVFLAQQDAPATSAPGAENPFDSLIAFYVVLRNPISESWSSCRPRSSQTRRPVSSSPPSMTPRRSPSLSFASASAKASERRSSPRLPAGRTR